MQLQQPVVIFPYSGDVVGGSIVSGSLIARYMQEHGIHCRAIFPYACSASEVFARSGVPVDFSAQTANATRRKMHTVSLRGKLIAMPDMLAEYYAAKRLLFRLRPALLHINNDQEMFIWGQAGRALGIPVIWHVRQEIGHSVLDGWRLCLSQHVILIAESTRRRFGRYPLPAHSVIYNAVDTTLFRPAHDRTAAKRRFGLSPDRLTIGYTGNLCEAKRPEWVVQAGIELLRRGVAAEFLIVGKDLCNGKMESKLKQMAVDAGCVEAFHFLGYREDVQLIMPLLDIFLLPSQQEPFGRVVIEAMACGAAVIATDAGGVPEIIDHGRNGLLVAADSFPAFQDALQQFVSDTAGRERLALAGQRSVIERFSLERMGSAILAIYRQMLSVPLSASPQ